MATEKIGIYRKWLERPPVHGGQPIPKAQWTQKRRHCWEVRWFGLSGKRYSKSFSTRNKAERFARELQEKINHGKSDKPAKILLKDFVEEHKKIMAGQIAPASLYEQVRALRFFEKFIGGSTPIQAITPRHAEMYVSHRIIGAERLSSLKTRKKRKAWDPLPDTINNLGRDFEVIRKRSGIERCTIHDLRRSAITNWAQHLPIQVVQQLAGHSNITTTRKYYLTVRAEDMTKASQVVNQILEVVKPD